MAKNGSPSSLRVVDGDDDASTSSAHDNDNNNRHRASSTGLGGNKTTARNTSGNRDKKTSDNNKNGQQNSTAGNKAGRGRGGGGCCWGCLSFRGNAEARGWALDMTGRTVAIVGLGSFVVPALLLLAREAAGCDADVPNCENKVYGIRPSSLFSVVQTVIAVLSAPLLPLFGAIVDYTDRRRLLGRISAVLLAAVVFPQVSIGPSTWFALAILFILTFFVFLFQSVLAYSYLPELVENNDDEGQQRDDEGREQQDDDDTMDKEEEETPESIMIEYTRNFTIVSFSSLVLYLALVIGISGATGRAGDTIATARVGVSISVAICFVCLMIAWFKLLGKRPAARSLPPDQSLWTAGFRQLYATILKIGGQPAYRSLRWFLIAISVSNAGVQALMPIMITFLTDQLSFTGMEIGMAVMLITLASIGGGWASSVASKWKDPVVGTMMAVVVLTVNTGVAAAALSGPERKNFAYVFAAVWGFGTAWKFTTDRVLVSMILPRGQDAELMGLYVFAGTILDWAPPLIFTAINEAGVAMQVGLLVSVGTFLVLGLLCYCIMGSYSTAVQAAERFIPQNGGQQEQQEQSSSPNHVITIRGGGGDDDDDNDDDCTTKHKQKTSVEDGGAASMLVGTYNNTNGVVVVQHDGDGTTTHQVVSQQRKQNNNDDSETYV